jgi:thiosulfate/3-mercaptopyruvate sulfurtransferase
VFEPNQSGESSIMKVHQLVSAFVVGVLAAAAGSAALAQDAPKREVLVTADWLEQNLDNPNVRVIEVSVVPGVYERGHIPGAVNFVWHTDFVDTVTRDIVKPERFQELVRAAGINNDSTIVLYGDNNNWFAAWGVWIFRGYGFEDVRLLDGGRVKWEADGRTLTTRTFVPTPGTAVVGAFDTTLRARLTDVLSVVNGERPGQLIDIRSPREYNGEIFAPEGVQELSVRAGHIPGAVNVPWGQNVNADGTFKSIEELRALYAGLGIDGSQPIITYCRIGERAALTWFVLKELLGYDVALYDGSWTEYGNVVGLPIVNPAGTIWGGQ